MAPVLKAVSVGSKGSDGILLVLTSLCWPAGSGMDGSGRNSNSLDLASPCPCRGCQHSLGLARSPCHCQSQDSLGLVRSPCHCQSQDSLGLVRSSCRSVGRSVGPCRCQRSLHRRHRRQPVLGGAQLPKGRRVMMRMSPKRIPSVSVTFLPLANE